MSFVFDVDQHWRGVEAEQHRAAVITTTARYLPAVLISLIVDYLPCVPDRDACAIAFRNLVPHAVAFASSPRSADQVNRFADQMSITYNPISNWLSRDKNGDKVQLRKFFSMIDTLWAEAVECNSDMSIGGAHFHKSVAEHYRAGREEDCKLMAQESPEILKYLENRRSRLGAKWVEQLYVGDINLIGERDIPPTVFETISRYTTAGWSGVNPFRLFAEWWWFYGVAGVESDWHRMTDIFVASFRGIPHAALLTTIVYWPLLSKSEQWKPVVYWSIDKASTIITRLKHN